MNLKQVLLLLIVLLLSRKNLCFVVRPLAAPARTCNSRTKVYSSTRPTQQKNILSHVSNKLSSWLRPKVLKTRGELDTVDLLKKQKNDNYWLLFPSIGGALERAVNRELKVEKRKAKPLLHQAQTLIQKDSDVIAALGEPIVIGSIVSQQKSTTIVNRKKSQQIWDSFQVAGPRGRGVATLVADKYAKGHLKSLRVVVDGIKYDIDV